MSKLRPTSSSSSSTSCSSSCWHVVQRPMLNNRNQNICCWWRKLAMSGTGNHPRQGVTAMNLLLSAWSMMTIVAFSSTMMMTIQVTPAAATDIGSLPVVEDHAMASIVGISSSGRRGLAGVHMMTTTTIMPQHVAAHDEGSTTSRTLISTGSVAVQDEGSSLLEAAASTERTSMRSLMMKSNAASSATAVLYANQKQANEQHDLLSKKMMTSFPTTTSVQHNDAAAGHDDADVASNEDEADDTVEEDVAAQQHATSRNTAAEGAASNAAMTYAIGGRHNSISRAVPSKINKYNNNKNNINNADSPASSTSHRISMSKVMTSLASAMALLRPNMTSAEVKVLLLRPLTAVTRWASRVFLLASNSRSSEHVLQDSLSWMNQQEAEAIDGGSSSTGAAARAPTMEKTKFVDFVFWMKRRAKKVLDAFIVVRRDPAARSSVSQVGIRGGVLESRQPAKSSESAATSFLLRPLDEKTDIMPSTAEVPPALPNKPATEDAMPETKHEPQTVRNDGEDAMDEAFSTSDLDHFDLNLVMVGTTDQHDLDAEFVDEQQDFDLVPGASSALGEVAERDAERSTDAMSQIASAVFQGSVTNESSKQEELMGGDDNKQSIELESAKTLAAAAANLEKDDPELIHDIDAMDQSRDSREVDEDTAAAAAVANAGAARPSPGRSATKRRQALEVGADFDESHHNQQHRRKALVTHASHGIVTQKLTPKVTPKVTPKGTPKVVRKPVPKRPAPRAVPKKPAPKVAPKKVVPKVASRRPPPPKKWTVKVSPKVAVVGGRVASILQTANGGQTATVRVAQDGSGDFTTIQAALDSIPKNRVGRFSIIVAAGVYREYLTIEEDDVSLIGEGQTKTIITGNKKFSSSLTTFYTSTVAIEADNFIGVGLRIENTAGQEAGQAVALRTTGDNIAFFYSSIIAYQDTLYSHRGNQYFSNCIIAGSVDFIFGNGATVFDSCTLVMRRATADGNVITAHKRASADEATGFVFINCRIVAEGGRAGIKGYLGRPWGTYARVIYINTKIDEVLFPSRWSHWSDSSASSERPFYAEISSSGAGADGPKASWPSPGSLPASAAAAFLPDRFIPGTMAWLRSLKLR